MEMGYFFLQRIMDFLLECKYVCNFNVMFFFEQFIGQCIFDFEGKISLEDFRRFVESL